MSSLVTRRLLRHARVMLFWLRRPVPMEPEAAGEMRLYPTLPVCRQSKVMPENLKGNAAGVCRVFGALRREPRGRKRAASERLKKLKAGKRTDGPLQRRRRC
jgi:hypothetical protein